MDSSAGSRELYAAEESLAQNSAISGMPASERIVIRNADLFIVVDDPGSAMTTISRMSERMGGFVVSSNLWKTRNYNNVELPEASITIRVPADLLKSSFR